jgi:hypothetical protein
MKLQEFFDTQKHTNFTDVDKLDLYQNVLYKKTKRTWIRKLSFIHAKYVVYSMIFVFLLFGMYGVYFMNDGNIFNKEGINTAQADYIAQVIDAQGNFYIEHDGVLTKTNNIGNGDTLLLKEGAQLAFEINSGTQSKIIGPAKLIIQKTHDENYKLNLVYGNFIKMEGNERKTQNIELAINDLTVKQEEKWKMLSFEFVKNGENQIIKNNGDALVVTKSNGTDKMTTMENNEVLTIQSNDIKLFANFDSFSDAVEEKNISQTFTINTLETETAATLSWEIEEQPSLLSLLKTPNIGDISEENPEVTKNISSVMTDNKRVLNPEQDEKINSNLKEGLYANNFANIEKAFIMGENDNFMDDFNILENRIKSIYQGFDIVYGKQVGDPIQKLQGLKNAVINLRGKVSVEYNVPPIYMETLEMIEKSLANILAKGYGSAIPAQETNIIIEETK